ncbi:MAG: hypothetical protein C5B57_10010 [Blastocatellia bacterium]|nr:MAG: hypothetical protein C5B57_10010 [Blastocatellia bacterium]
MTTTLSREDLFHRVRQYDWVHSIDLGDGVITPGTWGPPHPLLVQAFNQIDFREKKVLDIGCWDGLWSFEAEKRGASVVYATDYLSQRSFAEQPTFALAHDVLKSKVRYFPNVNVYDIRSLGVRDFDVVLFAGLYYHLKSPLAALAAIRQVVRTDGVVVVEGPVINNSRDCFAAFFYHDSYSDDVSNWWIPTVRCLREWVECSYFEITSLKLLPAKGRSGRLLNTLQTVMHRVPYVRMAPTNPSVQTTRRCVITARAVCKRDATYYFPDLDLAEYDVDR